MIKFLDLGANDGCSIKKFKLMMEEKNITDYEIYSFEAVPFFYKFLSQYESANTYVYMKAVSSFSGTTKIYLSKKSNGSSLCSDKISNSINKNKFIEVDTIDLAEFINKLTLNSNDELWVKMDVEGAEYELIEHLSTTGALNKITKMFMDWHYTKIPHISYDTHKKCKNLIANKNPEEWNAEYLMNEDTEKEWIEYCNNC